MKYSMERALISAIAFFAAGLAGCQQRTPGVMLADRGEEAMYESCEQCARFAPVREALASMTLEEMMATLPRDADPCELPCGTTIAPLLSGNVVLIDGSAACTYCAASRSVYNVGMDLPAFHLIATNDDQYWIRMAEGWIGTISLHGPFMIDDTGAITVVER